MKTKLASLVRRFGRAVTASLLLLGSASCGAARDGARLETPTVSEQPVVDPFQRLRRTSIAPGPDYWNRVGAALQGLATIEGAAYDEEYGVLTLHGKPAQGQGPFHLDDLMVALRAAFFESQPLGMTIDPLPDNPRGPEMQVIFFGGCKDTAFGWVLFECDRLLKSLSRGEDNLTLKPLRPAHLDDFYNVMELARGMGESTSEDWNRFWLTPDLEDGLPWTQNPTRSNGSQPVLRVSENQSAIDFTHCRLYLRTEVMALRNGKMVPVKGGASKSSQRFATHFMNNFAVFAEQYPVFGRAESLTRLAVIGEWLQWLEKNRGISLDKEFIRSYRQQVPVRTPTTTPAGTSSLKWAEAVPNGILRRELQVYGGVDLAPHTFFADDSKGAAELHRKLGRTADSRHARELSWDASVDAGKPYRIVAIPTRRTRLQPNTRPEQRSVAFSRAEKIADPGAIPPGGGSHRQLGTAEAIAGAGISLHKIDRVRSQSARGPPGAVPADREQVQPRLGRMETIPVVDAPLNATGSRDVHRNRGPPDNGGGNTSLGRTESIPDAGVGLPPGAASHTRSEARPSTGREQPAVKPILPPDAPVGLTAFFPAGGKQTYGLPKLVEPPSLHETRTYGVQGKPDTMITVVPGLALSSELGDIMVEFAGPKIDQQRVQPFYPPRPAASTDGLIGFYPLTRTLEFSDGTSIHFRQDGLPDHLTLPGQARLKLTYGGQDLDAPWPEPTSCDVESLNQHTTSGSYQLDLWQAER